MKIVILPGVGFQKDESNDLIIKYLHEHLKDCEVEWYNWKHNLKYPDVNLKFDKIREWTAEVLFDFQYALNHAEELKLPKADYYIGHSAGSLIALTQNKPCVIVGSPVILVEQYQNEVVSTALNTCKTVLNIVNPYDILSYPIPFDHVDNVYMKFWAICPLKAHTGYFHNKQVCKRVAEQIRNWETIKRLSEF